MAINTVLKYPALPTFLLMCVLYYLTLAPSVLMIDTGELASAIIEPGVAHATGYPLFTILGYLFMKLPLSNLFGMSLIRQANWFALLTTAGGVAVMAQVTYTLIKQSIPNLDRRYTYGAAIVGALAFGAHRVVWFQSVSIEVYGLHILLAGLVLLALLHAWHQQTLRPWLWVAVALGLSFSNHVSTIMLTPVIVYVYLTTWGLKRKGFITLGKMLALFFGLIAVLYSYLFIASSTSPLTNWGFIRDWESFKYHVTGQQFSTWVFAKGAAGKQFKVFIKSLLDFGGIVGLAILIPSLVLLIAKGKSIGIYLGLAFFGCLLWAINYDIHDIESYFLVSYYALACMVGWTTAYTLSVGKRYSPIILGILLIVVLANLTFGIQKNDYSKDYLFDAYVHDVLENAEPNALILSKQWDHWVASSQYFQRGEGLRTDIQVVDKELLRRIWYINYLEEEAPSILVDFKPIVAKFKVDLYPFEHGKPYDGNNLQAGYDGMITGIAGTNYLKRPVYITTEMILEEYQKGELKIPTEADLIPMGLYLQLLPKGTPYRSAPWPKHLDNLSQKPFLNNSIYHQQVLSLAGIAFMWRAQYELRNSKTPEAVRWLRLAKKLDPAIQLPPDLIGLKL